jgi:hypothetical protein
MENITFIFQGPYYKITTEECFKQIKKNFPGSEIIFSTWIGQKVTSKLVDKVIYTHDPGGIINSIWSTNDSTLRQFKSTYNALTLVNTEYCCKIRSDTTLENNKLVDLIKYLQLKKLNKLIFLNYLSVNPLRFPLAFHLCDWLVAGQTSELKYIYNHSGKENDGIDYFKNITIDNYQYGWYCKFRSEQYIVLNWIKNLNISYKIPVYQTEINIDIISSHNLFLKNHVLLVPGLKIGVKNYKRPNDIIRNSRDGLFSSNYYDYECNESLKILNHSLSKELKKLLYLSIKRIVLKPNQTLKFIVHIIRYWKIMKFWIIK